MKELCCSGFGTEQGFPQAICEFHAAKERIEAFQPSHSEQDAVVP